MRKLLLSAIFACLSFVGYGQVFVEGKDINQMAQVKVCELLLLEDMVVSPDIKVAVDYGQARKEFSDRLTDQSGKDISFPSAVAAINHMENNGWSFVQSVITPKGRGVIYRYYFRRQPENKLVSHQ